MRGARVAWGKTGGAWRSEQATTGNISAKELVALGNIKSFYAGLLKKLAHPLLKEIEGAHGVQPGQDPFTPRHTT